MKLKVIGDKDQDGFYWGELRGRRGFVPHNMITEIDENQVGVQGSNINGNRNTSASAVSGLQQSMRNVSRDRWGDIYCNMPVKRMIALYDYDPQELSPNVDAEVCAFVLLSLITFRLTIGATIWLTMTYSDHRLFDSDTLTPNFVTLDWEDFYRIIFECDLLIVLFFDSKKKQFYCWLTSYHRGVNLFFSRKCNFDDSHYCLKNEKCKDSYNTTKTWISTSPIHIFHKFPKNNNSSLTSEHGDRQISRNFFPEGMNLRRISPEKK